MSYNAIVVENLSKRFLVGHKTPLARGEYSYTLRDVIGRGIANFGRKASDVLRGRHVVQGDRVEEFWALRGINFEVKQGEILGIIGRNGAGKSTLLKVLSRISEPTEGRVILQGRTSSLLEVGTGFHPELTGRENIFLNGAILGMTQREIRKKFDEIVAFSEVEQFLDTPVKHYSSGMYVRLAFAVAAHLEPEILIVDEVLAVGDGEFQKKCLGKMNDVSRHDGRTVLFVSHNMEAVLRLCKRGLLLQAGAIHASGDIHSVLAAYQDSEPLSPKIADLTTKVRPRWFTPTGRARLISLSPSHDNTDWSLPFGTVLSLDLSIDVKHGIKKIEVAIAFYSVRGFEIASWTNMCSKTDLPVGPGLNTFRVEFPELRLLPGQYIVGVGVSTGQGFLDDYIRDAVTFEIITSSASAEINADKFGGALVPIGKISPVASRTTPFTTITV